MLNWRQLLETADPQNSYAKYAADGAADALAVEAVEQAEARRAVLLLNRFGVRVIRTGNITAIGIWSDIDGGWTCPQF